MSQGLRQSLFQTLALCLFALVTACPGSPPDQPEPPEPPVSGPIQIENGEGGIICIGCTVVEPSPPNLQIPTDNGPVIVDGIPEMIAALQAAGLDLETIFKLLQMLFGSEEPQIMMGVPPSASGSGSTTTHGYRVFGTLDVKEFLGHYVDLKSQLCSARTDRDRSIALTRYFPELTTLRLVRSNTTLTPLFSTLTRSFAKRRLNVVEMMYCH